MYHTGPLVLWRLPRPQPEELTALKECVQTEMRELTRGLRQTYHANALLKIGIHYFTL